MDMMQGNASTWAEDFLRRITLFEKCSADDLNRLAISMRKHVYNKGETILFQGIISHQLYLVVAGMVDVFSRKDKITRFLANLQKGAFFGEISLVKSCAATATIKAAVDETEIYTLDYDIIKEIMDRQPDLKADLEEKIRERNRLRLEAFEKQKEELAGAATAAAPAAPAAPATTY